jgi:hypothetical protein
VSAPVAGIGIDVGSATTKCVAVDAGGTIVDTVLEPTRPRIAPQVQSLLARYGAAGSRSPIVATGYGCKLATGATQAVTEHESLAGLHEALTSRIVGMVRMVGFRPPLLLSGGVARNHAVQAMLSRALGAPVKIPPQPPLMGAFGAALKRRRSVRRRRCLQPAEQGGRAAEAPAAVDGNHRAGHVAGHRRGEPQATIGNFTTLAEAAQRHRLRHHRLGGRARRQAFHAFGAGNRSLRHRIDANAERTPFERADAREDVDAGLGGADVHLQVHGAAGLRRRDVDEQPRAASSAAGRCVRARHHAHACTGLGEGLCNAEVDAAGAAGDENVAAAEVKGGVHGRLAGE